MVKINQEITSAKQMASTSSSSSAAAAECNKKIMKKYKGVRMRRWGSWVSEIRAPNQKTRIWLGSYSTAEAAARAYDAALLCLKGSSANLNFPITSSSHYYIPSDHTVMSPKSIQRVAAAAAAAAANTFVHDNINDSINVTTTNTASSTPPVSPPLPSSYSSPASSSSSSSQISSPSLSSSPSDQLDDDVSLMQSLGSYNEPISMMEPLSWYNIDGIQSPKYVDQMFFNGVSSFDPPMIDDYFLEDGDIRLWSFC